MQLQKQTIDISPTALSPAAQERISKWYVESGFGTAFQQLTVGQLMKFIIDSGEKRNLLQLLVSWANFGGELVDILWDFSLDILEDRREVVRTNHLVLSAFM